MNPMRAARQGSRRSRAPGWTDRRQRPQGDGPPANAHRAYERYLALAREASLSGDAVEAENCYQHAEHYFRVLNNRG
jgi:hypothetical protein